MNTALAILQGTATVLIALVVWQNLSDSGQMTPNKKTYLMVALLFSAIQMIVALVAGR